MEKKGTRYLSQFTPKTPSRARNTTAPLHSSPSQDNEFIDEKDFKVVMRPI